MSIVLERVTKTFDRKVAVERLSLEVRAGEVFAFLGPNGAGKTTTIKLMVGLLLPDEGSVFICGHRMGTDGRAAKAHLGYVPDQPFLYDKLTGREFLEFVANMYGLPRDEAWGRLTRFAERLRLEETLDRLTEGYSHGMKQKVALAAALLHEPRVLIVDEPMVGLDPWAARTVRELFRARANAGGTVFLSTHTLDVAEALADRIAIIHRGRIVAQGTLEELRRLRTEQQRLEDIFLTLTEEEAAVDDGRGRS